MKCTCLLFFLFLFQLTAAVGQSTEAPPYQEVAQQGVKVDKHASYPGGLQGLGMYVMRNLKYPAEARQQKIQGKVFVKFTVGTDGEVSEINVLRSDHPLLAGEAQRLMKGMGKWLPAYAEEKPVAVSYVYPLTFKLDL
jgi:TonB family protein